MTIAAEKLSDCKVKLDIEIPASLVNDERARIVAAFTRQAKIPGYRPGKTPAAVIEKRFRKEIDAELRDRLINDACAEAGKQENLEILGLAKVENELFNPDGAFSLTAEVVTSPDFALPEYKGIEVKVPPIQVTDEKIDDVLKRMQQNFSSLKDIEDRPLQSGDIAVIAWTATLDGQPLNEAVEPEVGHLANSEQYWVKLPAEDEEDNFLPGFAGQLAGLSPEDARDVTVTLPEDFQPEELQKKEVVFAVKVLGIKVQELPEIDDDLARQIRPESNLADLREEIRVGLEQEQRNSRSENMTNQILRALGEDLEFELPQHLLFSETQRQVNGIVQDSYRRGADESLLKEHQEEIVQNAQARAAINVKTTFILEEIAKNEKITVSDEELSRQVAAIAAQSGKPFNKVVNHLKKNNGFAGIRHDLMITKVLAFLRENATVTEVEPAGEEPS